MMKRIVTRDELTAIIDKAIDGVKNKTSLQELNALLIQEKVMMKFDTNGSASFCGTLYVSKEPPPLSRTRDKVRRDAERARDLLDRYPDGYVVAGTVCAVPLRIRNGGLDRDENLEDPIVYADRRKAEGLARQWNFVHVTLEDREFLAVAAMTTVEFCRRAREQAALFD